MAAPRIPVALTAWSMIGLGAGLVLGIMGNLGWFPWAAPLSDLVRPLGDVWVNALQMVVIPLVMAQLLASIGGADANVVGGLGGKAFALFVAMLVVVGIFTLLATPVLVSPLRIPAEAVELLRARVTLPEAALQASGRGSAVTLGEWLPSLVPANPFAAAAAGDILPLVVFTILVALAVTRLPEAQRQSLGDLFRAGAAATMQLITWILWGTPVAVFAIILGLAVDTGFGAAGILGAYIVLLSALLIVVIGLLYPFTALAGRTSLRRFGRAVAPGQFVAISTQSSLASLPALIEGAETHLRLPRTSTGFVLPLAASTFKLNQSVSSVFKFVFLAHVFGVSLTVGQQASFLLLVILLSFATLGLPRGGGGGFKTLPAYIAAGIPVEAVVVIEAVKTIPDLFMTVLNSTAYMSAATVLSRGVREARPVGGVVPEPVPLVKERV
jgi:proton glutamate symport protein